MIMKFKICHHFVMTCSLEIITSCSGMRYNINDYKNKGVYVMKKWLLLALVTAMMSVLIACGSSNGNPKVEAPIEVSEDEIASGTLEIVASNWEFDKEYYAIRAGEAIEVTVNSIDGVHGIEILNTEYNNIVNNKATEITVTEPGTYNIRCSVPCGQGHRTMTTKLVVVG